MVPARRGTCLLGGGGGGEGGGGDPTCFDNLSDHFEGKTGEEAAVQTSCLDRSLWVVTLFGIPYLKFTL